MLFAGGRDYDYDAEQEAIVWKSEGQLPDERSFFYVNYYLREGHQRLTDRNPGSVTTTLAEAFAREFAVLHKQMDMIYRSAFIDLATNSSLDHVVALLGLTRKDAKFASGEVLFKRDTPAPGDIAIPAGTLVSTDRGQNYETTDKRTLRKGQLSVIVPVRAQVEGPAGKVEAGVIKNINRPIFGIEAALNESATFFATQKETDEELRRRLQGTLERAGKATVDALTYGLIEDVAEITDGNIQVVERTDMPGYVEVKLGLEATVDPDLVRRVEEAIFYARPAGIRVVHNLPTRTLSASAERASQQQLSRAEALAHVNGTVSGRAAAMLPAETLAGMPEGVLRLHADVFLSLAEQNLSAAQKERLEDEARNQVVDYIESLPMGADLVYSKLLGRIVQSEDIADADLVIGPISATRKEEFYRKNLSTSGRKATIEATSVFVGLMEELVIIDVGVALEPKAGQDEATAKVSPALETAIRNAVDRALAAATTTLARTGLQAEIGAVVGGDEKLQLVSNGAVVINAEYEETGRLLNNTEEVSLEAHQVARLRDLKMAVKGKLDG
jgi:uncharacterized phage protein gp47/JayE